MALTSAKSYWDGIAASFASLGPPLRPSSQDIQFIEETVLAWAAAHPREALRATLLGVTPEIAGMRWPAGSSLIAVERSLAMAQAVWPGNVAGKRWVIRGNWLTLPQRKSSAHVVIGDAAINCLAYPDGFRALAKSVSSVLGDDGILILRCLVQCPRREAPEEVYSDLCRGAIRSFHAFKLRLMMALQHGPREGIAVNEVYQAWAGRKVGPQCMPSGKGWEKPAIDTIERYRGASTVYAFPTLAELRSVMLESFEEVSVLTPEYELGERCPTLVLKTRRAGAAVRRTEKAGAEPGSLQKSMVLASIRSPGSGIYIIQDVCDLPQDADAGLMRRAWSLVSGRHPALRTAVEFSGGKLVWGPLDDESGIAWREMDWTGLSQPQQQDRLEEFLRQDRESGFDFQAGIPMRFAVIRTSANSCKLVWTSHHALLDGRSYAMVWREWLAACDALARGEEIRPAALPADSPGALHPEPPGQPGAEEYWRKCFEGLSQTTDYVVDRLRPATVFQPASFAKESVSLSEEQSRQLETLARGHEISLNNLVQGAWALLLSRYSGRSGVVFGVTRAGRESPRDDAKVGFFINTLPLRLDVAPESDLGSWLKQLRNRWVEMREFEQTPLDQVRKCSGLPPGMPPFESVLVYEHESPGEALRKLGGAWRGRALHRFQCTDSPLTLAAYGKPFLTLEIVFDTRQFCSLTVVAMAGHLKTLLESFLARPDARLRELKMLTAGEEQQLVRENQRTEISFPLELCAHQLFERQVERAPNGVALDGPGGCISYQELNQRSNRLAGFLRETGAGPEDLVAICMPASPETVVAVLAALKAGAAFLPLDPALPTERLLGMLADARPKAVLCAAEDAVRLSAAGCHTLCLEQSQDRLAAQSGENLPNIATSANAAYAIYTSGSTGKPKAALVSHQALVNHTLAAAPAYGIGPADRRLHFASVGTDLIVSEIFNYLAHGATLVLGWGRRKGSVREFLRFLDERQITITGMPSAWWNELAAIMTQPGAALPRSLRAVIFGMEKANPAAFLAWKNAIGTKIRLFNAYGPTETSPTATVYEAGSSPWEAGSIVPIGKPLANTKIYVLDGDGNPVPAGVAGHLHIGGLGVGRGYLNAPGLTAQKFVPDPFRGDPGGRMYKTGDIVFYLPDGNLVFLGRADRQVKIRGFRIELEEIESVLAAHPEVRQCAVIAAGEESKESLAAFFTFHGPHGPSADALRSFLSKRLPEHMIPPAFVPLSDMPMTANGKIDRQALPKTGLERWHPERDFRRPSTRTELRLAAIWKEVLGVPRAGVTDNFFDSGADSLDATRLILLIEERFGREIPLASFWRAPTIERMASILDGHGSFAQPTLESSAVVPLQPGGSRIPFFCFPGADENPYYFRQLAQSLGPDQPFYVIRDPRPMDERGVYTVGEIAGRLIPFIRSVAPDGPYLLGGHCYGGIVAFEAARQLVERGEEVARLVLFEVAAPGYPKVIRHWRNYYRQGMSILRGRQRVGLRQAREHLNIVRGLFRRKAAVAGRRTLMRAGLKRVVEPLEEMEHPNTRAGRSYNPKALAARVIQFIAAGERHSTLILDDPRLGWREFVRGEFSICKTPGKAAEIFKMPHVRELAAQLREVFDEVNAASLSAAARNGRGSAG